MTMATPRPDPSHGADAPPLPLLTLDLDGVVCAPVFGLNVGIHRSFLDPDAPPRPAVIWPRLVAGPWDRARYNLRRPLLEAREALPVLARARRLVLLTGRRTDPSGWLRRHRLDGYFERVVYNRGPLRSAHYKLHAVHEIGPEAHVEDDPRTAQLLAQEAGVTVYLRDWPRNRDLDFAERVTRIATLSDLAARLGPPGDRSGWTEPSGRPYGAPGGVP